VEIKASVPKKVNNIAVRRVHRKEILITLETRIYNPASRIWTA